MHWVFEVDTVNCGGAAFAKPTKSDAASKIQYVVGRRAPRPQDKGGEPVHVRGRGESEWAVVKCARLFANVRIEISQVV